MSFAEVKERLKEMTPAELDDLALQIEFLKRVNDPKWRAKIEQADQGPWYSMAEVQALHERLKAEGR